MNANFNRLVAKLKEIFQMDKPELDFGIYRILRARREQIEDFLNNRLAAKVKSILADNVAHEESALRTALDEAIENAKRLGVDDPSALPKVREIQEKLAACSASSQAENEVYSHLLTFFSRYYDKGDFISQRRYKGDTYAIPYNGEEVKLYWANSDQYYIKSGEGFSHYDFSLPDGAKVHFRLVSADVTKDNIKDNDAVRCFVLWDPSEAEGEDAENYPTAPIEEKDGELYVYFQYRRLKKGTKQQEMSDAATVKFFSALSADMGMFQRYSLLDSLVPTEKGKKKKSLFRKYLDDYTSKNTFDYFIHKDLKSFLERELDFYIKNEMLYLDDIQNADNFSQIETSLHKIQSVKSIASALIEFMSQIENFQKKLWLKKKFVVQCDYCVTMDLVPQDLHKEVFSNPRQIKEWAELNTDRAPSGVDARMIDTRYFDETFKARLLSSIKNLDERCDGLLIRSENYSALRLLRLRYRDLVKAIFIDPPYNTGNDGFPYKDQYRTSSWLSMMYDRLKSSLPLLTPDGLFGCHIDEHEHESLNYLLTQVFGSGNLGSIVWDKRNPKGQVVGIAMQHESVHFAAKNKKEIQNNPLAFVRDKQHAEAMFKKVSQLIKKEKGVTDRVRSEYAEWLAGSSASQGEKSYKLIDNKGDIYQSVSMAWPNKKKAPQEYFIPLIHPKTLKPCPVPERGWRNPPQTMKELLEKDLIIFGKDENTQPRRKYLLKDNLTEMLPSVYCMGGSDDALMDGLGLSFINPKTVKGTSYFLRAIARPSDSIVMDYFAGSGTTGHATISLNRKDGGERKYILVEMGDHFESVLMPRLKKVVYAPDWKEGEPMSVDKGISHCFKYMTLESYEDELNNINLENIGDALPNDSMLSEYLLNYMLDFESRKSVINTDNFHKPFDYKLRLAVDSSGASELRKVDLVETFNYLLGLEVEAQDRHLEKGYVMVEGKLRNSARVLVVWRDCELVDARALNALLAKKGIRPGDHEFDLIYVNGDHSIANRKLGSEDGESELKVRSIEEEFLSRMFEEE